MHSYLRQSTASQSRALGPFLDDTDFKTAETGLTIANTDIKLVVNGGASANKNSGGGTHRVNGVYGVTFDATDTSTVGEMFVSVVVAGALPVFASFVVLEEAVYDALYAASAPGYLQPTTAGRTLDVSAGGEAGIDWANIGSPTTAVNLSATNIDVDQVVASVSGAVGSVTGAVGSVTGNVGGNVTGSVGSVATGGITAASFAADAITAAKIAADVTTELQSGLATAASLATVAGYLDTEVAAILAAVDTEVAAIKAVTDALPDAGALTSLATQASVNTIDDFLDTEIAALTTAVADLPTNAEFEARTLAAASYATAAGVSAVETDTQDIQSRLPAALNNGCIPADTQRINNAEIFGDGTEGNLFRVTA